MSDIMTVNGGTIPSNFSGATQQAAFANFFNSNVIVSEIFGPGSYNVGSSSPWPTATGITVSDVAVTLAGANAIGISGANDTVTAAGSTPYKAFLNGGNNDVLNTGSGPSTIFASTGAATINAGTGSTTVDGSTGNLMFSGGSSSNDSVTAGSGVTSLLGGTGGNNTLIGGSGWTMVTLSGSSSGDLVVGGTGVTTVQASNTTGPLTITTNPNGSGLQMEAFMGSGADTFVGGGTSHTVVQAGSGADVFGFVSTGAAGADTILGFNAADNVAFKGVTVTGEAVGSLGDVITLSDGTTITLAGIDHKLW